MKLERLQVGPGLALAAMSALLVVWLVWHDRGRISPGPLSAAHAQEEDLVRADGCEQCHGGGSETMASACARCHGDVAGELAEKSGFHGTLETDAGACATCHSEHHGAGLALAGRAAFALAGVADPARYDHARLDFALGGRHLELACKACHPNAELPFLPKGSKRFAGLDASCARCHADPHDGKLPDCAACHGEEEPFAEVARFEHPAGFALTGSHAGLGCVACHPKDTPHAVEAIGAAALEHRSTRTPRACADCHASPHAEEFVTAAAAERGIAPAASCERCHATSDASFAAPAAPMTPLMHAASGFPLEPPHADVACAECHASSSAQRRSPPASSARRAFANLVVFEPARAADDCQVCHGNPHGPQFELGSFAGQGCLACHDRHAFVPTAFDIEKHARTGFPLTASHAAVACAQCHRATLTWHDELGLRRGARAFSSTPSECSSCHADAHGGFFASSGCGECHATDTFASAGAGFDHAATGFDLAGAHARASCESCHVPRERPDAAGRTFGSIAERVQGDPRACASCHADAHRGFFDARVAAGALDFAGCGACHTAEAFSPLKRSFDHAVTGFALAGAHARAACASCHPPLTAPDATGRSFARASVAAARAAASCSACHADVHRGAFDRAGLPSNVDGASGCLRCHTTESFREIRGGFDHARWTGFTLAGSHAALDCASCHAHKEPSAHGERAFSRALGTDCASCHADPHVGQFARAGRTDCAHCHDGGSTSFVAGRFDHDRDARFALDATHAGLSCSDCHVSAALPGGGSAIRYKPLGTVCGDCHAPGGKR